MKEKQIHLYCILHPLSLKKINLSRQQGSLPTAKTIGVPKLPTEGVRTTSASPHLGNACCNLPVARHKP